MDGDALGDELRFELGEAEGLLVDVTDGDRLSNQIVFLGSKKETVMDW